MRHTVSQATGDAPEAYFHARRSVAAMKSIWKKIADTQNTRIEAIFGKDVPEFLPMNTLKIQYCLNNLVENAVKNTKNGTVRIVTTRLEMPSGKSYIALSVQDTGSGLSELKINTIFQRSLKFPADQEPKYGVIDTGLPMTQDLISELGGKILVQSKLGLGSTFTLLVPLEAAPYSSKFGSSNFGGVKNNACQNSPYSHLNILVVDDYNLNQLTIKTLLHGHKGKIFSASQGYEALEIMQSCPVDLVLMDIHMPIMDGVQTTLKIRESVQKWSDVQIFAMTADPQYHHSCLYQKIGMDGALAKPFRKADILRVLAQCANTQRALPPNKVDNMT